eukprot:6031943-Pleurochrysis_carterae.AAC.4
MTQGTGSARSYRPNSTISDPCKVDIQYQRLQGKSSLTYTQKHNFITPFYTQKHNFITPFNPQFETAQA